MGEAMLMSASSGFLPRKVASWEFLPAKAGRKQRIAVLDEKLPPLGESVVLVFQNQPGAPPTRIGGVVKLVYKLRAKDADCLAFVIQVNQATLGGSLGLSRLASPTLQLRN